MDSPVRDLASYYYQKLSDNRPKGNHHNSDVFDGQCSGKRPPAWVSCDDCRKWRRIPSYLANVVNRSNFKWNCKDNEDKAFADCSIPQELTDEQIDTELKSYAYNDVQDFACIIKDSEPISWAEIRSNVFLQRDRKTEKTDEIMVCNCMPPINGSLGCGDQCLNRMLNTECVRGTCPCGDRCSNQQFQKRKYAKLELSSCGKKGAGLQLLENVSKGQFLIEYVGEVLDPTAYKARQRSYASMGHKHFYFMMLDGGEVIDACTKGNLSRFINHSCDPNCRSEKWMVNGEICVGLFAIRDIKKGDEVTFNYQYVPVSGAAVKKCFCGAANCRGYIGGKSSDVGAMVQADSVDDLKPMMILPELEKDTSCRFSSDAHPLGVLTQTIDHIQSEGTMSNLISVFSTSSHSSDKMEAEETLCRRGSGAKPVDLMKSSSTSFSVKKAKGISQSDIMERDKQTSIGTRQIERIEEKLKKVSDGRGGIGNHKHAAVYLKLLSVITAEGDNFRGVPRAKGLSFMLDALLKTKPHSVLVYIISKNGLQMLHNVMKQNCNNYMRTPIIRKLLKVLEFLAVQGILTQERIRNCPYAGTESFEKSMMALTRHPDMQVRDIARKLRDELKHHSDENSVRKVLPSQQNTILPSQQNTTSVTWTSTCITQERRIHEPEYQCVQPSDVTTKNPPLSAKGTEADLMFDDEAPPGFQSLCTNTHLQNPCTDLDGASVTRKPPVHESGYDMFGRFWPPWPGEEKGPLKERWQNNSQEEKWLLKDERPREERCGYDMFGRFWPPWPEEEKGPPKDRWRNNSQEESNCLKRPREHEILLQGENWRRRPQNTERRHEDKKLREEENWTQRLRQEESNCLKRPRENEILPQEEKWRRRPQHMERPHEDNWRREEENCRKRSPEEKRPRAEHKWMKRPRGEHRSREEHQRQERLREDQKWLKGPPRDERSREEQKLRKRLRFEEMLPQEEKENRRRRLQEMERSPEDDRRKKQPEKEKWRKCMREEKLHWKEREHRRRNGHGR